MKPSRALFLDRDGIFNEVVSRNGKLTAPRNWQEVRLHEGLKPEIFAQIKTLGFFLVLVTNQPDIERGLISQTFVEDVLSQYQKTYGLDALYYCPFANDDHPMKKPNPGMFLQAAQDLSLTLSECFHLGDTVRDIGAARRCGCQSVLWQRPYNTHLVADKVVESWQEVVQILASTRSGGWEKGLEFHTENLSTH